MKSKLDWKGVGQFVAVMVQVWSIIKVVVTDTKVGLEILDWVIGKGKDWCTDWLQALVEEYKKSLLSPAPEPKIEHIIDFDSAPVIPSGLTIAPDSDQIVSRVRGKRKFTDIKVRLHLDNSQKKGKWIKGYDLKPKLEGQKVYGAQLLDFYLANPDKIPEELKTAGWVFFWGTIFRNEHGHLYVRFLLWDGARWLSDCDWLDRVLCGSCPAAVSASTQG